MKVNISEYYPEEGFSFEISARLITLLSTSIETQIFKAHPIKQIKATELEIILSTRQNLEEANIDQLSDKEQANILSYQFHLPYSAIIENDVFNQEVFIHQFTEALRLALIPLLKIKEDLFVTLEQFLIHEVVGNKLYNYNIPSLQQAWLNALSKGNKPAGID